jgi:hypothetical protein
MAQNTLTITDNRTDQVYSLPVENGTVRAMDQRQIKASPEDFGSASLHIRRTYGLGDKTVLVQLT